VTSPGAAGPVARVQMSALVALTFTTGIVDAIGFLGLDRVFTGNMTGNVVILGMALTGADGLPVVGPLLALVGFLVGAAVGGRTLRHAGPGWTIRITGLVSTVGALVLVLGAAVALLGAVEPVALTVTTALGGAMGLQAAAARFLAVKDVTTVVVTSTLTALAADSRLGLAAGGGVARRIAAVLAIGLGALAGAALLQTGLGTALLVSGLLVLGTGLVTHQVLTRVRRVPRAPSVPQ
jgi:uncharacterized membrane protein YoaK (UPF0700 family)